MSSSSSVHYTQLRLEGLKEQEKHLRAQLSAVAAQSDEARRIHLSAARKAHLETGGTMLITAEEMDRLDEQNERMSARFARSEAAPEADVLRATEEAPSFMSAQNKTLRDIVASYAGKDEFLEWEISDDGDDEDEVDAAWPNARPVYKNPDLWEDAQDAGGLVAFVSKEQARDHSFHFNEATGEAKVNFDKWDDEMRAQREAAEPAQPRARKRHKAESVRKAAPSKARPAAGRGASPAPAKSSSAAPQPTRPRPGRKAGYVRTNPYFGFVLEGLASMGNVCIKCMEILTECKCACTQCKSTTREACQLAGCRMWGVGDEEVETVHMSTCKSPYSQDNTDWPRVVVAQCSNTKRAMMYMQAARDAGHKSTPLFGAAKDRTGACSMCRRHVRRISTRKCPWCTFCDQYMRERAESN